MNFAVIALLAFQISATAPVPEGDIWDLLPLRRVSEVDLPATAMIGEWKRGGGLILNDLSILADVPKPSLKAVRDVAKQLKPIGVSSVADYSLVSTEFPLNTVTVRVFIFEDAEKCQAWWTKKYEYENWEKHYAKVESSSACIVHSTQTNKTAMAFGNVWLTSHQLGKGERHIDAANHVLSLLTNGKKTLPVKPKKHVPIRLTFENLNVNLTPESSWTTLPSVDLARINGNTKQPVLLHAKKLKVLIEPKDVYSKILLFQSRRPLGATADNPNFLFAAEKAWTDEFEKTGDGYLKMMADRIKKLGAPTKFSFPPKEIIIDDQTFYYADAENTLVKNAKTKQRYICGFTRGHYIYFIVSYNNDGDDDFETMMSCVKSLKLKN